jgi:squalene-hopene/tetraprenyl-beta-curcumene cyclase
VTSSIDNDALQSTIATLRQRLLAARNPQGFWEGHLSSSALSTATAVFALATIDSEKHRSLIERGLSWLCDHQNADGGWGDTVQSPSNLSTTLLCYSALAVPVGATPRGCPEPLTPVQGQDGYRGRAGTGACPYSTHRTIEKVERWLRGKVGALEPEALARAVEEQYGKDRTFSVPILTMAALAGRLGTGRDAWRLVKPLPFELAVLPHRLYKWLRLPVVSYALPALIAIGQARYEHLKPGNPLTRFVRHLSREKSLSVLTRLQPKNGGFLEAAPLTSFVVMSLAASGHADHEATLKGVEFLTTSIREDGSWPIDTNLATWVTTLSINALFDCGLRIVDCGLEASNFIRNQLIDWLLSCQHRDVHPYTHAAPGGWAWSNLPGAVPDGDDTAGALIALHTLSSGMSESAIRNPQSAITGAVCAGVDWLLGLQNTDGGIPTFCRGWTKLPFDKSTPDITAHAVGAMSAWLAVLPAPLGSRAEKAMSRALQYLRDAQRADGSWVPLWFGNQLTPGQENPVYGTSRAVTHLSKYGMRSAECGFDPGSLHVMCERAIQWLVSAQNSSGGWGGDASVPSSIEETALAVDALAAALLQSAIRNPQSAIEAVRRGADWLIANTNHGQSTPASPIGLYFARLWYFEELYPLIFSLSALGKVQKLPEGPGSGVTVG